MSSIKSEFPKRLQGIWRSGSLRPSDFVPPPAPLPTASESRRRDRYRVERGRGSDAAAVATPRSENDGPPEIGAVLGTLAERLRQHVETASAQQQADKQAAAERTSSAPVPTPAPPARRRRSGLGGFIRLVIIVGFIAFMYGKVFDQDLGRTLEALLVEAEQALSGETPEPAAVIRASAPENLPGATGGSLVRNGSFESPKFNGELDTGTPQDWQFAGDRPYPRIRGASNGYPRAPDGISLLAVHGEYHGTLYQNLARMEAGATYTFRAVVLHSSGANAYRASLWRVEANDQRELAFISHKQVDPPEHDGLRVTFSYQANADDAGKLLRLQLSDNGTKRRTRSAFDDITVRIER